jgi:hypothetical protein
MPKNIRSFVLFRLLSRTVNLRLGLGFKLEDPKHGLVSAGEPPPEIALKVKVALGIGTAHIHSRMRSSVNAHGRAGPSVHISFRKSRH